MHCYIVIKTCNSPQELNPHRNLTTFCTCKVPVEHRSRTFHFIQITVSFHNSLTFVSSQYSYIRTLGPISFLETKLYTKISKQTAGLLLNATSFKTIRHILGNYDKQNFSRHVISSELLTIHPEHARLISGAEYTATKC